MHHAEKMCIASWAWFNRRIQRRQEQFQKTANLIDWELQGESARTYRRGALTIDSKDLAATAAFRRKLC
jgi:hypothetical protein